MIPLICKLSLEILNFSINYKCYKSLLLKIKNECLKFDDYLTFGHLHLNLNHFIMGEESTIL